MDIIVVLSKLTLIVAHLSFFPNLKMVVVSICKLGLLKN